MCCPWLDTGPGFAIPLNIRKGGQDLKDVDEEDGALRVRIMSLFLVMVLFVRLWTVSGQRVSRDKSSLRLNGGPMG